MYAAAQKRSITNANEPEFHDIRLRGKIDTEVCDGKTKLYNRFQTGGGTIVR